MLPQPKAKGSMWNILGSLRSGGDATVNFKFGFLFDVLLVGYPLLTVRWPPEEITQRPTLVGAMLFFLRFKCCTFLFNICSFHVQIFRTETTGITILQFA